ncbi:MAG: tRNA (guanosine(46)-N7)-methyltransferase TrmB [Eubacterium sp.]|nr:tRNA (guanosine(46)-N7)-methyltransferase TrmB [Eubacterium sp.]
MRLKNVPGAREAIEKSPLVAKNPKELKGKWNVIKPGEPVRIEIGMGKGRFIMGLSRRDPDHMYIGMEKYSSVIYRGLQKLEEDPRENLILLCEDAENLEEFFAPGEVERIYLNFSDPWPKDRHAKRRLTSDRFLARYVKVLSEEGTVEFKTDNRDLFDFSLEMVEQEGWNLLACTRDLHADRIMNEGNIMTEYEEKFSAMGNPIYKLIASPPRKDA